MRRMSFAVLLSAAVSAGSVAEATPRQLAVHAFPAPIALELRAAIQEAARAYDLDPNLLAAMAFKESTFNPRAVSRRGAQGILQLMPRTARALGVRDSFDTRQNVFGGALYIRQLLDRFHGDLDLALASYNLGPERIAREGKTATPGVVKYVGDIKAYYAYALRAL